MSQPGQQRTGEKKNKISSTRQTVIENGDMDHHDDDTETLIGSQYGKARSRESDDINLNNGLPSLQSLGEPDMKLSGTALKAKKSLVSSYPTDPYIFGPAQSFLKPFGIIKAIFRLF